MSQRNRPSRPPVRPVGDRPASKTHHHKHRTPEQEELLALRRREREERTRRTLRVGLLWVGGFLLVAGIGGFLWYQSASQQEQERLARATRAAELRAELLADGKLTLATAATLQKRIEATQAEWENGPDAAAMRRQADRARELAATAAAQQAVAGDVQALQRDLAAEGKTVETWQGLHTRALAVRDRVPKTATEVHEQLAQLTNRIVAGWFDALLAKGIAAAQDPKAALGFLVVAEDLAADAFDGAHKDRTLQQEWKQRLQTLTAHFDTAMKGAFPETTIASVPQEDLRATEADWVASKSEHLVRKVQGDTVSITCDDGKGAKAGVVVLRHQAWHACSLSFDVKLEAGKAALFPRAQSQFTNKDGGLVLATVAAPGCVTVPAGQEVHVDVAVVGDQLVATVGGGDPQRIALRIGNEARRGSFAAVVHPGTKLALRNLRVRRLG